MNTFESITYDPFIKFAERTVVAEVLSPSELPYRVVRGREAQEGFRGADAPPATGLLFEGPGSFVMNGVGVDLDAAFLDKSNRIMEIIHMAAEPPASKPAQAMPKLAYRSSAGSQAYTVEARSGFFAEAGWRVGDTLVWDGEVIRKKDG